MAIDPRTPVLVGAAQVTQRVEDPAAAGDTIDLMTDAVRLAAADAGAPALAAAAQQIAVPQGTWSLPDPARLVAQRIGAVGARTARFEIGVLQQDLLTDATSLIARGELDVALVIGGEARYRARRAAITGAAIADAAVAGSTQPGGTRPDRVVASQSLGVDDVEIERFAVDPPSSYALIENAIGHAAGRSPEAQRHVIGALWARLAAVAAGNPHAWDRSAPDAAAITTPGDGNRMIATPYTKRCCSQWNVDQAVALVLCSAGAAERRGVPRDRWVFPHGVAVSNLAVPVVRRRDLHRCPGAALAGAEALAQAGIGVDDLDPVDLYSCFPAAVEALAAELSLPAGREVTVTGGMAFAGGPLNSYVLHALATMVPMLRARPDARGLSSSVSGFLVKQGFSVWSATPPAAPPRPVDVGDAVAGGGHLPTLPVDADATGTMKVASWTVVHDAGAPSRAVAICDAANGARTIATTDEPAACAAMVDDGDWIGRAVAVPEPGRLVL